MIDDDINALREALVNPALHDEGASLADTWSAVHAVHAVHAACSPDRIERVLAEIERLRAELETERMRLAACGVVALANTPESASKAREMRPEYRSASLDDVERAVDDQLRLRAELAAAEAFHKVVVSERNYERVVSMRLQAELAEANAELSEQARLLGISGSVEARLLARVAELEREVAEAKRDADRYRWLRAQQWDTSKLAVVVDPKRAVKFGYDLPSLDRLDAAIDDAMRKEVGE